MEEKDAFMIKKMTHHVPGFTGIRVCINSDRATYPPELAAKIPPDQLLVTLKIPRKVDMPRFWGKFREALNQESIKIMRGDGKV